MSQMTGEVSVRIESDLDEVWDLVSDVTRIGEFSPETFEARWTGGHTGPAVGATFKGHVRRNGRGPTYWTPCRVTVCEPQRAFEFVVGTDRFAVNNWGYRLEPDGDGTVVTEYFRLEPSLFTRIYWTLAGRWRGQTNEDGMRTTLERMKARLEEGT
jgi:hypothetical protein